MRAKAILTVTAGVIPDEAITDYSKRWTYSSDDYERDRQAPPGRPTIFSDLLDEAHIYAKCLSNPAYVNWVCVDWMWI